MSRIEEVSLQPELSVTRVNLMRAGYLLMVAGLAATKWPLLPDASRLPLYEGVTVCMLIAMSLLALVGLRHPVRMLPVLLFETAWKLLWLAAVALPRVLAGDLDAATSQVLASCTLVVVVIAVTPWRYAWRTYVRRGDLWR